MLARVSQCASAADAWAWVGGGLHLRRECPAACVRALAEHGSAVGAAAGGTRLEQSQFVSPAAARAVLRVAAAGTPSRPGVGSGLSGWCVDEEGDSKENPRTCSEVHVTAEAHAIHAARSQVSGDAQLW